MIRVLIADDHPVVRSGLEKILTKEPRIVVAGESGSAREVMEFVRTKECDVIILDISLPDKSGLEILELFKREKRRLPVLILSMHKEELYAAKAFKAGASGYLTKESVPGELVKAVMKIASGGRYVSPSFGEKMVFELNKASVGTLPHEGLTNREMQILDMIVSGLTPKAAAEKLCLSVKTVNAYRMRILNKMNMKTNAQLIRYALENKLIE